MRVILASKSPRRAELLRVMGLRDFTVLPAPGEERVPVGLAPGETVVRIAEQKARAAAALCTPDDLIIAADTLVYLDGVPLGKPADAEEAAAMLRRLSGARHTVYTGLALQRGDRRITDCEATDVFFRELEEAEIAAYVATGEPMDKAGAYGIQTLGCVFVRRLEGDYFNVVGLPLCRLYTMLAQMGAAPLAGLPAEKARGDS